ncbi:MAG: riboflavin synthase subunit alpha [Candidatus Uhrbacteria bacterium]|nr:riboflavin synthase subunit alpha [Candidatus Uhrbacteria bacterium]
MFTGIIQALVPVVGVQNKPGLKSFVLEFSVDLVDDLKIGASVAIDGACTTVVNIDGQKVSFDAMEETLQKTTIGRIAEGSKVNIERSAKMGDEIGGHLMSGHIVGMAQIVGVEEPKNNRVVEFKVPAEWMRYILDKGFIGLDGASLTVVDPDKMTGTFKVWLIPETLRVTTFGNKGVGDFVNVEINSRTQTIVDTVEQIMKSK